VELVTMISNYELESSNFHFLVYAKCGIS